MVGADQQLPLPWLAGPLADALRTQQAHALLVYGPAGVGQFELSLTLAQAWLCEGVEPAPKPCGRCVSCRLVQARTHPDLLVLLPEALQESLGWGFEETSAKASKAKPSKEVKVEAVRAAVNFAQATSSRGRLKVVVIYPAERMNGISANTLLKTLEEPPGVTRFILGCGAPDTLLPTIRSRCQALHMALPEAAVASDWLAAQGVAKPDVLLRAAGGQPLEALAWSQDGVDAATWAKLPALVAAGVTVPLATWPLPRSIDALQKLCHDALLVAFGEAPRYFPPDSIEPGASAPALLAWSKVLSQAARSADHPWNAGLMVESLVEQGRHAMAHRPGSAAAGDGDVDGSGDGRRDERPVDRTARGSSGRGDSVNSFR